ncbi:hypothetical protein NRIC_34020 [Enterococcus florum]|uniref:NlpC/P60 domain-containing protein n=1 Tax=Enterococcus florum TaxID=2480627 RepID=A0A4P5PGF5_9ENTE|nr:glucosaminidase domain-containing protein [Enterococcus florum]GCF95511.1 hypothetical protein NRIC_34020 [Enterococcus florum]
MKYNQLARLMTVGALIAPAVLSTHQAFAAGAQENSTGSESAISTTTTQPSLPFAESSKRTSSDSDTRTSETSSSSTGQQESSTDTTDSSSSSEPEEKTYSLLVDDEVMDDKIYKDKEGNQLIFKEKVTDIEAGEEVAFTVKPAKQYKLKKLTFVDTVTDEEVPNDGKSFEMPEGDVSFKAVFEKDKTPVKPDPKPEPEPKPKPKPDKPKEDNKNDSKPSTTIPNNDTNRQPAGTPSDVREPSNQKTPTVSSDVQTAIVKEAYEHLGKPYVWGAKGPNAFDCSGLAYYVYARATGHYIGGWTGTQQYAGTQIPLSAAQPGDLLFWGAPTSITTHVAIYIGNGQYIHAPQPGDVVKIGSIGSFSPTFALRVGISGLPAASASLSNAFGKYSTDQPFIVNRNQSTDKFIEKIAEQSREIGQKNDIYASVMIAQAILESSSGNSSLAAEPNYNLFGIKGKYKNQSVSFTTTEQDKDGKGYKIKAEFRKYPSYKESLEDYAKLMKDGIKGKKDFYKAAWKSEADSYKDATKHLQGRYATDKKYAEKLNAIIEAYKLTTYDEAKKTENKRPELTDLQTSFTLNDVLKTKLITSLELGPEIPTVMSTQHFVSLFKADSLIALAANSSRSRKPIEEIPPTSPIYIALSKGLMAILPPVE